MHPIQERERKGEVEDPGMELGILRNKKGLCISRRSRPDAKPQKTPPPCAFEVHHTYTYGLPTNQYICTSKFFINTHLLTTYLPRISTNNNQRYIYLPTPNQIPPQSLESSTYLTYLVHSTNHLTFSYRPSYLPVLYTLPIYTGVGESAGR